MKATDNLSGVMTSYYELDGGAKTAYGGSLQVATIGSHTLSFWSVDYAGNVEKTNVSSFQIVSSSATVLSATPSPSVSGKTVTLTVLYTYGSGDRVATVVSTDPNPTIDITPEAGKEASGGLVIERALYGPVPSETTGWLIMGCMALFIASFAFGPGVVVWITLSELMPTRIRSTGMGFALLLNQGISTAIAAVFLPVVGNYGYAAMFLFWALCTVVYFSTAAFFLPETKGKTLEEIEAHFDGVQVAAPAR